MKRKRYRRLEDFRVSIFRIMYIYTQTAFISENSRQSLLDLYIYTISNCPRTRLSRKIIYYIILIYLAAPVLCTPMRYIGHTTNTYTLRGCAVRVQPISGLLSRPNRLLNTILLCGIIFTRRQHVHKVYISARPNRTNCNHTHVVYYRVRHS